MLTSVFQVLRRDIDDYATQLKTRTSEIDFGIELLVESLIAAGTVSDVISYLRARVADWDTSSWHKHPKASVLERGLRMQGRSLGSAPYLTASQALEGAKMLVVLGGPGAGKTWLARRYAREAATSALLKLEAGEELDNLELPLLTTWDQWSKASGAPTQTSLVESSFASGIGHSDIGHSSTSRLIRTFLQPRRKMLVIIDSLDEAADVAAQASRLHELRELPEDWRLVVTSRLAAWDATYRATSGRTEPQIVELTELSYPEDVRAFVESWFVESGDPQRGLELFEEIDGRSDVARAAVVPLMLTFYCLLAEDPAAAEKPLPSRRRDLYGRLVRRLLRGHWTPNHPGPDAAPDLDYCEKLLASWAWEVVRDDRNRVGLGGWTDSFVQPRSISLTERRAIDHVAPKTAEDEEGNVIRRFVHRTFLEHFVAEYVASLEPLAAAETLVPHLWFDSDWEIAAAAAIAAHNRRDQGALLQNLIERGLLSWADPGYGAEPVRQVAAWQINRLLLTLAQESEPEEWTKEHRDLLHHLRVGNSTSDPLLVSRSAHWEDSNQEVRQSLLTTLPDSISWGLRTRVEALKVLGASSDELSLASRALLTAFPDLGPRDLGIVASSLKYLGANGAQLDEARRALLKGIPDAHPTDFRSLVAALAELGLPNEDVSEARKALLAILPEAYPSDLTFLLSRLRHYVVTREEMAEVRRSLLAILPSASPSSLRSLLSALGELGQQSDDFTLARRSLLAVLPNAYPSDLNFLVARLRDFGVTSEEAAEARKTLLTVLPNIHPSGLGSLLSALRTLDVTSDELVAVRNALVVVLPETRPSDLGQIVEALLNLGATEDDVLKARGALVEALPRAARRGVNGLIEALSALQAFTITGQASGDFAEVRKVLLEAISEAAPADVGALVSALKALGVTEVESREASDALLRSILEAQDPRGVGALAEAASELVATPRDLAKIRGALLAAIPATAEPGDMAALLEALPSLGATAEELAAGRRVLLDALSDADDIWAVAALLDALPLLGNPSDELLTAGRTAILETLPYANITPDVIELIERLPALGGTTAELVIARKVLLDALPRANPWELGGFAAALKSLGATRIELSAARAKLLEALPGSDHRDISERIKTLIALGATTDELTEAREITLATIPKARGWELGEWATALRSLSSVEWWLRWVSGRAAELPEGE